MTDPLTPKRLFSDTLLHAGPPREIRLSPDGRFASFLKAAQIAPERLDLWGLEFANGRVRRWLAATELPGGEAGTEQRHEQERKRLFGHGITGHAWSADSTALLVQAAGNGHLLDPGSRAIRQVTPAGHEHSAIQLSPKGRFVSYVRDRSLFFLHLDSGIERAVAHSPDVAISFGIADFLAQEEMHRFDGHWWSPNEDAIVFTRVDESEVPAIRRFGADALTMVEQRYPFAGAKNPRVELGWYDLKRAETRWLDYADEPDDYLARVQFAHGSLFLTVQNRAQNRLRIKVLAPTASAPLLLLEEVSNTWINLNQNFTAIGQDDYLFTSERSGTNHLFRHRDGKLTQITQETGHVEKILHAAPKRALVSGWLESPTERHLIDVNLATGRWRQMTEAGWHELSISGNGTALLDCHSTLDSPGEIGFGPLNTATRSRLWAPKYTSDPHHQRSAGHATPTLGSLRADDGQTLHFRLTRPSPDITPCPSAGFPLIVWVYGGPGVQIVRDAWPPPTLQLFAQNGFAVLELDNRGSAHRGSAFEAPLFRHLGEVEVRDQIAGARHAARLDWVDANRVGVFGHSYGGYMTLMCLAKAPELFRAGASVAPVTDWRLYDTHYTERFLGQPDDNPEGYLASSVFAWLDGLRGHLLLMHGMADDNVLFAHTAKLVRELQRRHFPFELMTYPGAKHALQETDVAIHRFDLILDFFRRTL